jgi:hypothetical protein
MIGFFATMGMLCWIMAGRPVSDHLVSVWGILLCVFALIGGGFAGLIVAEIITAIKERK